MEGIESTNLLTRKEFLKISLQALTSLWFTLFVKKGTAKTIKDKASKTNEDLKNTEIPPFLKEKTTRLHDKTFRNVLNALFEDIDGVKILGSKGFVARAGQEKLFTNNAFDIYKMNTLLPIIIGGEWTKNSATKKSNLIGGVRKNEDC